MFLCKKLSLIVMLTSALLLTLNVSAQTSFTISGEIVDSMNSAIDGVTITLKQSPTNLEQDTKSSNGGKFIFTNLSKGNYKIIVESNNFLTTTKEVVLPENNEQPLIIQLQSNKLIEDVVLINNHITGTSETVQHIPGTIQIVDQDMLERSRVFNINEALRKVPGINVRDEEGFGLRPNIGIRGLNPTRSTKVLLLEDGIPLSFAPYGDNASYYHPPIERFESIEVLKGSGQIVYGPVTIGGVINYITPTPPTKSSGSISLVGGNRNYFNSSSTFGTSLGNTGIFLNYLRKQGQGARDNTRSGLHDFLFKSVTTLTPQQLLTFKATYYKENSNVTYSGLRENEYAANPRQNLFRNDFFYGNRFGGTLTHSYSINPNFLLNTNLYGAIFERHWWRQSSNSAQRPNDSADPKCGGMDGLLTDCGNEGRLRTYYTWGIDPRLRLNYELFGIRNEMDFGIRFHFETQDRKQKNGNTPTARNGILVENNERYTQAYSAFVQNRFIINKFTITPGIRVEKINYKRINNLANDGLGISGTTSVTQVIPGIGISYQAPKNTTIFAGVHRGFAPPRTEDVINNLTGGTVDLSSELSWNYEAGIRSHFIREGIHLDASYFRMNYENQIIPSSIAGGNGTALTNGGKTLHQGFELATRIDSKPIFSSSHNFYTRFNYTFVPTSEFRGVRFSNIPDFTKIKITGNRLPYSPKHLLNASVGYISPKGFDFQIEANYTGKQFGDDLNTINPSPDGQRGLIPSYIIWNSTFNHRVEAWHTTFFITVKNVFDKTFIIDRTRGILPSSPRLIQVGMKFHL